MFGLVLWRYLISSVKTQTLGLGYCHLDPSSHLLPRTDTKTEHWNYSFARFGLELELWKNYLENMGKFFK